MSFGLSWRANVAPVQTGAHRPAPPLDARRHGHDGVRRCWMAVATGMTELRHGHDAPPLGSRLRGNDGGGRA